LLDFLVDHHIPHTIATGSGRTNIDFFVEHLSLNKWFDLDQVVYDDESRSGKPAPDVYLQAAGNLSLHPGSCVVVEDSRPGIQAAYAAGIGYIIALGPAGAHPHLAQLQGVNEAIENLHQFPRRLFL
jgi:beta-phosphoglucomutase-like phosphatase (HAD superfamily)